MPSSRPFMFSVDYLRKNKLDQLLESRNSLRNPEMKDIRVIYLFEELSGIYIYCPLTQTNGFKCVEFQSVFILTF